MARVKRGNVSRQKHKKILKLAKGFRGSLSVLYRQAKPAVYRALGYAYRDRRQKKRDFRRLWISRISAAVKAQGLTYSQFMAGLKSQNVLLNRKVLADLAVRQPEVFAEIVSLVKG